MGTVRQRFFAPRVKAKSYEELNAWLEDRCTAWAKAHRHPERPEATIWEAFEAERPSLGPYRGLILPWMGGRGQAVMRSMSAGERYPGAE